MVKKLLFLICTSALCSLSAMDNPSIQAIRFIGEVTNRISLRDEKNPCMRRQLMKACRNLKNFMSRLRATPNHAMNQAVIIRMNSMVDTIGNALSYMDGLCDIRAAHELGRIHYSTRVIRDIFIANAHRFDPGFPVTTAG